MKVSINGINLIKQFEGCRLEAYYCPAGVLTIGYGHTGGVKKGLKITQAEADRLLIEDLAKYEAKVNFYDSVYNFNQNEFDALVSFCYNIGNITQLTANGTRTKDVISNKMLLYTKANGKVLAGLVKRREAEKALFDLKSQEVDKNSYEVGKKYKLNASLAVRSEASKNASLVGYSKLKASDKKHDATKNGYLDAGTTITAKEIVKDSQGNTWIKIASGYIAAIYNSKIYIE